MKRLAILALPAVLWSAPAWASWELSDGDDNCAITGEYEDDGNSTVTLAGYVDGGFGLFVANDNWSIIAGKEYDLAFVFDEQVFTGSSTGYKIEGEKGFWIRGKQDLADAFRKARRLGIVKDSETVVLLAGLGGSAAAMTRMDACIMDKRRQRDREQAAARALEEKRKRIPADPFFDPLAAIPTTATGSWVTNYDYPPAARDEKRQGVSEFKLSVNAEGQVSACEITKSSGHADLDEATCRVLTRRAHFNSASDPSSIRYYSNKFTWKIGSDSLIEK